jgi:hypothetical protein
VRWNVSHVGLSLRSHPRRLADIDNKGKLNVAEFHVAMGLIYRRKHLAIICFSSAYVL